MKKANTLTTIFLVLLCASNICFALGTPIDPKAPSDSTAIVSGAGKIVGALQIVGYLIAVGMIIYIGIKYIMASGSEKADLKGLAIKYVIGAILIVFGTTIAKWVFTIK